METIRVNFVDFWPNLDKRDNYFYHLLSQEFNVIIDEKEPDILFHSVDYAGRQDHRKYDNGKTLKVWFTGENQRPNFNECHLALSFDYSEDPRNYRLPLWSLYINWFDVPYNEDRDQAYLCQPETLLQTHLPKNATWRKFCSFIASQPKGKRMEFISKLLSRGIDEVACGGRLFNNTPLVPGRGDQIEKIYFLRNFQFNVAMENTSYPGYCTEKILHPMMVQSLPVYWGDPLVGRDFNEESFINCHNYSCDEEIIDEMFRLEADEDAYLHKLSKPWFKNNEFPDCVRPENVLKFLKQGLNNVT